MDLKIVKLGNSSGVIIPKPIMEQLHFSVSVEAIVENSALIITAKKRKPREGWAERAIAAGSLNDYDKLLDETVLNEFDNTEWTW